LNSYFLPNNNSYEIKITKTEIEEKLGEPYNPCKKSTKDKIYFQTNFIEMCINNRVANKYNCTLYGYFQIKGLEECKIQYKSLIDVRDIYNDGFKIDCIKECPKECETMKFITELTSQNLNQNFTSIIFFITDFSSLKIKQIPKTNEWSFILNIGGDLGLFIGISALSFNEIFAYILDILSILFNL
jgi:hypothetical protein